MDFTFLTTAIQFVLDKLNNIVKFFGDLYKAVFIALWGMVQDVVCLVIDVITSGMSAAAAAIPSAQIQGWAAYWDAVPQSIKDMAVALGVPTALGIIGVAIGIRLVLQLIPFVRLGS